MAQYVNSGYYIMSFDGVTYTITSSYIDAPTTIVDTVNDGVFAPGEDLSYDGDPYGPGYTETYVGEGPRGIITTSNGGGPGSDYFYVTEIKGMPIGREVPITNAGAFTPCFCAGTMIATPDGAAAIETLEPGDLVITADGQAQPVKWLFVQTVSTVFADPLKVAPVRISRGALGDNLPVRDLLVSPDHALLLDGLLVQAGALVGATGVAREATLPKTFAYYHLELADHSLVLVEGVAAETFMDNVTRRAFDNWPAYEAEFGAAQASAMELDFPRVKSARQLPPALSARLGLRDIAA